MKDNLTNYFNLSLTKPQQNLLIVLTIIFVSFLAFSNSSLGEFVYDDITLIQTNNSLNSLSKIPELFLQSYFGEGNIAGTYRPLTMVSFALNYAISGLEPYSYHLVNITINTINSLLVYWIVKYYSQSKLLSIFTALLFSVHPVHSEAVAAIYGRPELLVTMFLLITWIAYVKSSANKYYYFISLLTYFLSLFCKESGIVFFGILLLVQFCTKTSWKEKLIPEAKSWGYILTTIPYLIIRTLVTGAFGVPKGGQLLGAENFLTRLYTMSLGYVQYFKMLVWPFNLATEYDYSIIPKTTTLNLTASLSLILIFLIIAIAFWQSGKKPIIGFAILFFFITTSIVSNIFFPTGILIAERVIYLPLASICLLLAAFFYQFYQLGWQRLSLLSFTLVLSLMITATYYRNLDFQNNISLFTSVVKVSPTHAKATYALADAYEKKGDLSQAEIYYKKALTLNPGLTNIYAFLANLYISQNRRQEAQILLTQALNIHGDLHYVYVSLARLYRDQKDYQKAIEYYQLGIKSGRQDARLEHELGLVFYIAQEFEAAKLTMKKAIELDPYFAEAKVNLARILQQENQYDEANLYLSQALKLEPNNADANNLCGAGLLAKGDLCQAKTYLLKAINLDNQLTEAHNNLGLTFVQMNLYTQARREFRLALQIDPTYLSAKQNLISLNEKEQVKASVINCN